VAVTATAVATAAAAAVAATATIAREPRAHPGAGHVRVTRPAGSHGERGVTRARLA
jgi:hypothetical protein